MVGRLCSNKLTCDESRSIPFAFVLCVVSTGFSGGHPTNHSVGDPEASRYAACVAPFVLGRRSLLVVQTYHFHLLYNSYGVPLVLPTVVECTET